MSVSFSVIHVAILLKIDIDNLNAGIHTYVEYVNYVDYLCRLSDVKYNLKCGIMLRIYSSLNLVIYLFTKFLEHFYLMKL
jgi:hypothetical protein